MMYKKNFGEKIRVLQFPLAASNGGITKYVLNLWKNIDKKIIQFDFMTFSSVLDFENDLLKDGCKVYHLSCYPEVDQERFSMEFKEILSQGYDVIELHTSYWKNTIMEKLARQYGVGKIIVHAHSTGIAANLSSRTLLEENERHFRIRNSINEKLADYYLACSLEAANWLFGDRIPSQKISIIKNTIETKQFRYDQKIREQKRQELRLTKKYVIGHVGRMEKEKNHNFILDIFEKLHNIRSDSTLVLVGDGSYRKSIQRRIIELKIQESVIILGEKKRVSDYLQAMDAFIFPSLFEGFGIALLEAQCSGLQCIGSANIPVAAFVTENAKRIPLDEPERWINTLLEIEKGYDRKSKDIELTESGYDTETEIKKIEKIYMGK